MYFEGGGQTINLWSYCLNHLNRYKYRDEAPHPLWNTNYGNNDLRRCAMKKAEDRFPLNQNYLFVV